MDTETKKPEETNEETKKNVVVVEKRKGQGERRQEYWKDYCTGSII